jgi:hypothetical protein
MNMTAMLGRHSSSASRSVDRCTEPNLFLFVRRLLSAKDAQADLFTVCLAMIAGVTADGCFAQTAINQQGVVTDGNAPQVSEVAVPAVTPAPSVPVGKTREQVMRELEDFQKNGGPALMLDIYRGGS